MWCDLIGVNCGVVARRGSGYDDDLSRAVCCDDVGIIGVRN